MTIVTRVTEKQKRSVACPRCGASRPRKVQPDTDTGWMIMHPSNGAILAYCDTEEEADRVIALLAEISEKFRNEAIGESGARS